jgi:RNA polymerase sigma-70 factor (ECF subfamily)
MATILPLRRETPGPAWALEDDDILLDRIRGDDEQAYRVLVERHIDRAYGLALRILRNAGDAEDVTQDAFIKTWQHRHAWQAGRARFSTWLYRVVVNRCIDLQRRPRGQAIDDVPEPLDEADDAVTTIHKREMSSQLEDALARLPPQQRTALALSYYEDLGNAEVASIMGTTVEAVESLLKRGRQRLRTLLKRAARDFRGD